MALLHWKQGLLCDKSKSQSVLRNVFFFILGNKTCFQGWIKDQQSCYKLFQSMLSWTKAAQHCGDMDSRLVTLNNEDEQNFILQLQAEKGEYMVWIGYFKNVSLHPRHQVCSCLGTYMYVCVWMPLFYF